MKLNKYKASVFTKFVFSIFLFFSTFIYANVPFNEDFQSNAFYNKTYGCRRSKKSQAYDIFSSHKKHFVWFKVFKAASETIEEILIRNVPDLTHDRPKNFLKTFQDYFKFAFVRNSWDRVVSCYCHKVVNKKHDVFKECYDKSFDYFVDYLSKLDLATADRHIRLQTRLIPVKQCHFIGRMDNFVNDLKYVCSVLEIEMEKLPHRHKNEHAHYSSYYNVRTQQIIAELYKEDIETFGFLFEKE